MLPPPHQNIINHLQVSDRIVIQFVMKFHALRGHQRWKVVKEVVLV